MSFRHNSTGIDTEKKFQLLPEGESFIFKIFDAEEGTSTNGNNMVRIKCSVVNDERFPDVQVWHWVVFLPAGQKGDWMSVHFRKCIGVPYGGDDEVDAKEWVGKTFVGRIKHELYQGKLGHKIAEVSEVPADGLIKKDDDEVPF